MLISYMLIHSRVSLEVREFDRRCKDTITTKPNEMQAKPAQTVSAAG